MSTLMIVKVLGISGLGAVVVWWQFYDLAQEKKRAIQRQTALEKDPSPDA